MAADPAILKRIRACPFACGGRVRVRYRANGYSLFARRSGEPLARLRLTGDGDDDVVLLYPSHRGGWEPPGDFGALATPLDLALERLSLSLANFRGGRRLSRSAWQRHGTTARALACGVEAG